MFLLRHGQSYFNLLYVKGRDPGIEDPELTALGHEQARAAAARLVDAGLTRIIVSPYTRALQTAEPLLALPGVAVEVAHEVREMTAFTCDVGSHPEILAGRFPHHDFSRLPARWWPDGRETKDEILRRAGAFRAAVAAREDSATTLLVSHWGFIMALTGCSVGNGEILEYDPVAVPEFVSWTH